MNIRPLNQNVLLGPIPPLAQTPTGLLIPAAAQEPNSTYLCLAVGPKVSDIAPGDTVFCPLYTEHVTLDDGTGRKLVDARHVLAVL